MKLRNLFEDDDDLDSMAAKDKPTLDFQKLSKLVRFEVVSTLKWACTIVHFRDARSVLVVPMSFTHGGQRSKLEFTFHIFIDYDQHEKEIRMECHTHEILPKAGAGSTQVYDFDLKKYHGKEEALAKEIADEIEDYVVHEDMYRDMALEDE